MITTHTKPRIAWFSPLNLSGKSDSIAAYTSDLLLPQLVEHFSIDIYSDLTCESESYRDCKIHNYLSCYDRHRKNPYDLVFYQYEDTKLANFVRLHLGLIPGITLFHDLLIKEELPPPLTFSPWPDIINLYKNPEYIWPDRYPQPDRGPFAYREVALSPISLYSSSRLCGEARRNVEERIGEGQKWLYPKMLYLPLPINDSDVSTKNKSDKKIIAYSGSTAIEHRAHKVLEALKNFEDVQFNWLINKDEELYATEMLNDYKITNYKLFFGRNPERWSKIVSEADIALHTLFSVYGTLGPYLPISMLNQALVVVTDFAEGESLPDNFVFKIEPGEYESQQLVTTLKSIFNLSESDLELVKESGRSYAIEHHNSKLVATELSNIFYSAIPFFKDFWQRWQNIEALAKMDIINANIINQNDPLKAAFDDLGWSSRSSGA